MRTPSRRMSAGPKSQRISALGWCGCFVILVIFACFFYFSSVFRWGIFTISALVVILSFFANFRLKRRKEERKGESICTFARSLPARKHDTWVVRAVYEELSSIACVPLRPEDDWEKDLELDPYDLDEAAIEIARRARRSMEDAEKNPFYAQVKTIADVIRFMEHQKQEPEQIT